jgi:small subunit ribosomal protein S8
MYYNLLSQIKNALLARKDKIVVPFSRMDMAIANVFVETGYLKGADTETIGGKKCLVLRLVRAEKKGAMNDFKIVSKPSRHLYRDYRSLRPVRQGHGLALLSTSKGIMSDKEARKQKIGGEYLFEIW